MLFDEMAVTNDFQNTLCNFLCGKVAAVTIKGEKQLISATENQEHLKNEVIQ